MLETIDDYPWNLMHFRAPASRTVLCPCVGQSWVARAAIRRIKRSRPSSFDQGAACSDLSISLLLLLLVRPSPFISSLDQTSVRAPFSVLDYS